MCRNSKFKFKYECAHKVWNTFTETATVFGLLVSGFGIWIHFVAKMDFRKWKVFMFKMWIWVPHCYMMIVMWQDRYRTVYMIWKGCHGDANIWMIFMVCIVLTKGEQGKVRFSKSPNKIIRWVGDVDCSACGDDFPFPSHHSEIIIRQPIFLSVGRHRTQNMLLNRSQLRLCYISQSVSLF